MEREKIIIANQLYNEWEECMESIQHIDEYPKIENCKLHVSIVINDGWGNGRVYIPKETLNEVLGIVRKSLVKKVAEIEQQIKEL